ncbi:MAG: aldo/keto reductase, partial [Pseudomonadota bacterium]
MQKRELGNTGITLPSVGLGCMGLSEFYGPPTEAKAAVRLLHEAIELGVVHFDTAEMYGMGSTNEQLLGTALHDRREQVFIATKFGPLRDSTTGAFIGVDGSRENCRRAIEGSLRRLRTDYVDLYYLHRVDTETPIETTVEAMAELVEAGMVRAIGLSEASAETLKRASSVHPIAALQSEYSIFSRDIESEVIPACLETGTSLVAYSPLGRGLLSGRFSESSSAPEDYRASTPRFQSEALAANAALVAEIDSIASELGVATAQIALAWVLSRGEHIVTIPGTTKLEH